MTGIELIAAERSRQIMVEGWSPEHDDEHHMAQLTLAAFTYASIAASQVRMGTGCVKERLPMYWPWSPEWWKPSDDPVRNLVKAGALIAAEIDRLQRKNGASPSNQGVPEHGFPVGPGSPQEQGE